MSSPAITSQQDNATTQINEINEYHPITRNQQEEEQERQQREYQKEEDPCFGNGEEGEEDIRDDIISQQSPVMIQDYQEEGRIVNRQEVVRADNNQQHDLSDNEEDYYQEEPEEHESESAHKRVETADEFEHAEPEEVGEQQRDAHERANSPQGNEKLMKFTNLATGSMMSNIEAVDQSNQYRSQLISKLKQDDSYMEPSQADISHQNHHIIETSKEEEDNTQTTYQHEQPSNLVSNQQLQNQQPQEDLELIKTSKYYQKFLNGESLNESYSAMPSNLLAQSSLQNTAGWNENQSQLNQQGSELNVLKVKLFESNSKLMQEMNKNKEVLAENSALKKALESISSQLRQTQNSLIEANQKILSSKTKENNPFITTFGQPVKHPSFADSNTHKSTNEHEQQRLDEEKNKNNNLRNDLEVLRTRLLQEMNNTGQIDQKSKEMEQTIQQLQYSLSRRDQIIQEKTEELKKITYLGETFQGEIASLQAKLKKSSNTQDDIDAARQQLQMENADLKSEVKNLQTKMTTFVKDNHSLFSEIHILKQKVEKAEANAAASQLSFYQQKAEINQNNPINKTLSAKQQNINSERNLAEINELKAILSATQKQLEIQKERNEYFSQKLQEINNFKRSNTDLARQGMKKEIDQQNSRYQQGVLQQKQQQQCEFDEETTKQQRLIKSQEIFKNNKYSIFDNEHEVYQPKNDLKYIYQQEQLRNNNGQQLYFENLNGNEQGQQKQFNGKRDEIISRNEQEWQNYENQQRNISNFYSTNQQPEQRRRQERNQMTQDYQKQTDLPYTGLYPQQNNSKQDQYNQQLQTTSQFYQPELNIRDSYQSVQLQQELPHNQQQYQSQPPFVKTPQPQHPNHEELFYQNLDSEKLKLQQQSKYIPIGVTSQTQTGYFTNTSKIKELDDSLNKLLNERNQVQSELLKLEESKRKSSMLIQHKQELEKRLSSLSIQVSTAKNQLRSLHALK